MEGPSCEEKNVIKDVRSLFRLNKPEKETNDDAIKSIRNLFTFEKANETIKDCIIRDIRN